MELYCREAAFPWMFEFGDHLIMKNDTPISLKLRDGNVIEAV